MTKHGSARSSLARRQPAPRAAHHRRRGRTTVLLPAHVQHLMTTMSADHDMPPLPQHFQEGGLVYAPPPPPPPPPEEAAAQVRPRPAVQTANEKQVRLPQTTTFAA